MVAIIIKSYEGYAWTILLRTTQTKLWSLAVEICIREWGVRNIRKRLSQYRRGS